MVGFNPGTVNASAAQLALGDGRNPGTVNASAAGGRGWNRVPVGSSAPGRADRRFHSEERESDHCETRCHSGCYERCYRVCYGISGGDRGSLGNSRCYRGCYRYCYTCCTRLAAKLRRTPVTFATLFDAPQPVTDGDEGRNAVAGEIGSVAAGQK